MPACVISSHPALERLHRSGGAGVGGARRTRLLRWLAAVPIPVGGVGCATPL